MYFIIQYTLGYLDGNFFYLFLTVGICFTIFKILYSKFKLAFYILYLEVAYIIPHKML